MKTIISIILLSILTLACKQVEQSEPAAKVSPTKDAVENQKVESRMSKAFILGTWQNIDHKEVNFFLHLNVDDDFVAGEYCSKALKFFFEDCSLEDEGAYCSVRGPLNALNIEVGLESCINGEIGRAEIQRQDSTITLTLLKSAGEYGKDHLVPEKVKLKKISNEPFF